MKILSLPSMLLFGSILTGCTTLSDVNKELKRGGYALWYPAEENIEPGQIWRASGKTKIKEQRRPLDLPLDLPSQAQFITLTKTVDANASLDAQFTQGLLGKAGDLSANLKLATVKKVELNFGYPEVVRLTLGDLNDRTVRSKLSSDYLENLRRVKDPNSNYFLIAAVVRTSGLKYTFTCEDTAALSAKAPAIAQAISADFQPKVVSNTQAVWEIPQSKKLVVGIALVKGKDLNLNEDDLRKTLADRLESTAPGNNIRFENLKPQ